MKEKRSENQKRVAEKTKKSGKKSPVEAEIKAKTSKTDEAEVKAKASKKPKKEKKPTDKLADKSGLTIFLQHIFGDAQKRTLHRLEKRVAEINKLGAKYSNK